MVMYDHFRESVGNGATAGSPGPANGMAPMELMSTAHSAQDASRSDRRQGSPALASEHSVVFFRNSHIAIHAFPPGRHYDLVVSCGLEWSSGAETLLKGLQQQLIAVYITIVSVVSPLLPENASETALVGCRDLSEIFSKSPAKT